MEQLFGGFAGLPGAFAQGMYLGERQRAAQEIRDERKAERERAARMRQEEVLMQFGENAVVGPDGNIDILKSAQRRALSDEAERVGRLEGFTQSSMADANPELRSLPAFRRGMAAGMAERQLQDFNLDRQLAVEAAREKRALGVQELRGEQGEAARAAQGWENMIRALNQGARVAPEALVEIETGGGNTGQPRVRQKVTRSQLAEIQAQQQEEKAQKTNAGLDQVIRDVKTAGWSKVILTPDGFGGFEAKEGGMLKGGEPAAKAIERLEAAKIPVRLERRAAPAAEAETAVSRFLQGLTPEESAAPVATRMPMSTRPSDTNVRDAVNPQRPPRRFVIVNGEPIPAR